MKYCLFVSLRDDDAIARFDIDHGVPEKRVDFGLEGGPAPMVINAQKTCIFAGLRKSNELVCLRVGADAGLSFAARASLPSDPCFIGLDKSGEFVFTAYYGAGQIAVHRWDEKEGKLTETQRISTEKNAHSVWLDPTERYVYVPHTGPNKIYLYVLDKLSGTLLPRTPPWFSYDDYKEPRHLCFHPSKNYFYAVNEGSSTLSVFLYNRENGTIELKQTVSTLPGPHTENKTAEIRITPDGRHLYASNRGHNSISCYKISDDTGSVEFLACTSAPAVPRSFDISPDGNFLYAAGQDTGELATFTIEQNTGTLKELSGIPIGRCPIWVMAAAM